MTPSCLAMARLLIPSLRSWFISSTSLPAVLHPIPQNIPFEFRKYGQHACESANARRGEIEHFAQRNEAHVERRHFLKRVDKVKRSPPGDVRHPGFKPRGSRLVLIANSKKPAPSLRKQRASHS